MLDIYSTVYEKLIQDGCAICEFDAISDNTEENVIITVDNCEPCCLRAVAKNLEGTIIWQKEGIDKMTEPTDVPFNTPSNIRRY